MEKRATKKRFVQSKKEKNKFYFSSDTEVLHENSRPSRSLKVRLGQNKNCEVSIYSQNKMNKVSTPLSKLCKYSKCNDWVAEK